MFNKSEIMKAAWAKTRALGSALQFAMGVIKAVSAQMLKQAWPDAKVAKPAKQTNATAKYQLMLLENKTHWNWADYQRRDQLAQARRTA